MYIRPFSNLLRYSKSVIMMSPSRCWIPCWISSVVREYVAVYASVQYEPLQDEEPSTLQLLLLLPL
jgi:hypothetical protein